MAKRKSAKRTRKIKRTVNKTYTSSTFSTLIIILALLLFVFSAIYMSKGGF